MSSVPSNNPAPGSPGAHRFGLPHVRVSHWLMMVPFFAGLLATAQLAGIDLIRDAHDRSSAEASFFIPLAAAAGACAAGAFWHRGERMIWGVLAVALACGAAAEAASLATLQGSDEMPAAAALAYVFFCAASGVATLAASGDFRLGRAVDQGLGVCALGLATIWSWLFLAPAETGADLVHSSLDLLLALSVLAAFCNHGWPLSRRFAMLAGGFGLIAVADSMHTRGILTDVLGLDLADALPFAGAALITAAACLGIHPLGERKRSGRFVVFLSLVSILLAVTALVYDHYSRLPAATVLLASLTLIGAGIGLAVTQRGWRDARVRAREAEAVGAVEVAGLEAAIVVEPGGRIVACNEQACRLFHRGEAEIVGAPVGELLDQAPGERPLEEHLSAAGPGSLPGPIGLVADDGQGPGLPVEVAVGALKESELRTLVVRDVSERRRREEENRRLAAIIRSSDDAVLTKDLSGVISGWNQGAERLYGYSAAEAIGANVADLIVPSEWRAEVDRVHEEVGGAGESISFETQRITKEGTLIDVSLRAFPILGFGGEVTAICTVAHDISDRRRRERAEELETEAQLWRGRLRRALGDGSLLFHGQPIFELSSGRVHHHELLVRMQLDGELVSPGSFLPFAEETELIRDLDLWAVERGIALAAQLPVAINLSARSLGSRSLLSAVERRLGAGDSPATNLTFEITETAAAENMKGARELVGELTKMGCAVALDDFGTGYGSFTYLRHLPVTQLKIDVEFIAGIENDAADRRVVESMLAVARNFEMDTVAEGVESREAFERLDEMGVDLVQGNYVGRPQPLELERKAIHG